MINTEKAWQQIVMNAAKAIATQMQFHSLKENKPYNVVCVENDSIVVLRVFEKTAETLTKTNAIKALEKFNNNSGKPIPRRGLIEKPVIIETALVLFCPRLSWDINKDFILLNE